MNFPAQFLGDQFPIIQLFGLDFWDGKDNHWLVQQWARFSEGYNRVVVESLLSYCNKIPRPTAPLWNSFRISNLYEPSNR